MPLDQQGNVRVPDLSGGFYRRTSDRLIGEANCANVRNMHFDKLVAEQAKGMKRLTSRIPCKGGVRMTPPIRRSTVKFQPREGYIFCPLQQPALPAWKAFEAHFRIEEEVLFPESGPSDALRAHGGITGRYEVADGGAQHVLGDHLIGGEHQAFILAAEGVRDAEVPRWGLGIGCVRPEGLKNSAGTDISESDRIVPIVYSINIAHQRIVVAACDFDLYPKQDYHVCCDVLNNQWYVNGVAQSEISGASDLLGSLADITIYAADSAQYFGRGFKREPGIEYNTARSYDWKHIYAGKLDLVSGVPAGALVPIANQQMASVSATANSYRGYRMRVKTGLDAGKIYVITGCVNPNNDATFIAVIQNAVHNIAAGDTVDIIPPVEPISLDVTMQEFRRWDSTYGGVDAAGVAAMAFRRLFADKLSTDPYENPCSSSDHGGYDIRDLQSYWPMDEDGGLVVKDEIGGQHGYFGPGLVSISETNSGPAGLRSLWLDGETHALRVELADDPNFKRNHIFNLGHKVQDDNHWNFGVRMSFCLGAQDVLGSGGTQDQHPYQTLFSLGDPVNGTIALECRVTRHGVGANDVYFVVPDGSNIPLPTFDLEEGRWYNAVIGIEALRDSSSNPQRHYCYFHAVDANLTPAGEFSAAFNLDRVAIDVENQNVLLIGASCKGETNLGNRAKNHAMIGLSNLGWGFHPTHYVPSGTAPTLNVQHLSPFIPYNFVDDIEQIRPPVTGPGGGVQVTGSAELTNLNSEDFSTALRRWPLFIGSLEIVERRLGEAPLVFPDNLVVRAVNGSIINTIRPIGTLGVSEGPEVRAQTWSGFTLFQTPEPAWDLDLNTGREAEEVWALTQDLFLDLVGGTATIKLALDAHYEFLSPWKWAPYWHHGIVKDYAVEIQGMKQYKTADGQSTVAVIVGGSLFEWRNRWVRDHPFDEESYCFEFQRLPTNERKRLEVMREGQFLYGTGSRIPAHEAVYVDKTFGGFVGDTGVGDQYHVIESFIKLPDLAGRRTISSYQEVAIQAFGGLPIQYNFKKNHVFQVVDGDLWMEIGVSTGQAMRAKTAGKPIITANTWHHVKAVVTFVANTLTSIAFYVDGKAVTTSVASVGPAITKATVPKPSGNKIWLGASGGQIDPSAAVGGYPLVDGLGGRMAGWASYTSVSDPGATVPVRITNAAPHLKVAMDDNDGVKIASSQETSFPGVYTNPRFEGSELVHIGSGMGWERYGKFALAVFNDILYITNKITRPWRWNREHFTPAGLRAPSVKPGTLTVAREPMRVGDAGSDLPAALLTDWVQVGTAAPPHLQNFTTWPGIGNRDIGAIVYVPPNPNQGGAGDGAYGLISLITAFNPVAAQVTLQTATATIHQTGANDIAYMVFRKPAADPVGTLRAAMQNMESDTPWSERRLVCDGKNRARPPMNQTLTTAITNKGCAQFKGASYVEFPPFQTALMADETGTVLDIKCYLKVDQGIEYGDAEQVLCEYALDGDSGLFRIVFFDGGRLRFEFFDHRIGEFRSIRTVGQVITADQWYYLRFSYRFKRSGSHFGDTEGGWEPDLRWLRKGAGADQYQKDNDFRDELIIVACEGLYQNNESGSIGDVDDAYACSLLTLPGCQSPLSSAVASGGTAATHNHSQKLLNTGLMKDNPYLTPEEGDALYPTTGLPATPPKSGIELTMLTNSIQNIAPGGVPSVGAANFQLPTGFCLPRQCSMNRDNAWDRAGTNNEGQTSQIVKDVTGNNWKFWNGAHPAYPNTNVGTGANLAAPALGTTSVSGGTYGRKDAFALIVKIYTITTVGGSGLPLGSVVDKATGDDARTLALVHLGTNDLDMNSRGGVSGHTIFLTDDPVFGGDGLGTLKVGAAPIAGAGVKFFCTIELMNGTNQSVNSTNRLVTPTLLEQGENPVGVQDSPDFSVAPMRIGGTIEQGEPGAVKRGFRGKVDDFMFSFLAVSSHATNVYTPDKMPPDCFFHGPADTRIQSLPPLRGYYTAILLDDVTGTCTTTPALVADFDTNAGRDVPTGSFSDALVPAGWFKTQGEGIEPKGEHRIRVRFRDPDQNVRSNPSDELVIRIAGQEGSGSFLEAAATFLLKGIPVSGDRYRPSIYRDIFRTLPDGGLPLLWATIKDNTTVTFQRRSELADIIAQETLEFDNGRPPICGVLMPSETNLFFADIDDAPNIIVYSKPNEPGQVPGTNIVTVESSRGGNVVGLGFLRGLIVPVKENAVFAVQPSGSVFRAYRIGQAVGCLSHQSFADYHTSLWFLTQTGVSVFRGNQTVHDQSLIIERYIRDSLDIRGSRRSWGASYLSRDQYMCSIQETGDEDPRTILTGVQRWDQFGNPYMVWSLLYPGIPVLAMCEWQNDPADMNRVMVGSRGVVYEHDSGSVITAYAEGTLKSALQGTVKSNTTGSITIENLSGSGSVVPIKDLFVNVPYMVIREYDRAGLALSTLAQGVRFEVISRGVCLKFENASGDGKLWTDKAIGAQNVGDKVVIGGYDWLWESKWFEEGLPEDVASWHFLDLYFKPDTNLTTRYAYYEILGNYDDTTIGAHGCFPLSEGHYQIPLADVKARAIKVRIKGWGFDLGFQLSSLNLRVSPALVGQRQP